MFATISAYKENNVKLKAKLEAVKTENIERNNKLYSSLSCHKHDKYKYDELVKMISVSNMSVKEKDDIYLNVMPNFYWNQEHIKHMVEKKQIAPRNGYVALAAVDPGWIDLDEPIKRYFK